MKLDPTFTQEINDILTPAEAQSLIEAIETTSPIVAVRANISKTEKMPNAAVKVPWCEHGAILDERPQFTFDPMFHAGCYYVQDPSSMFIYHAIKHLATKPVKYLDLCAAPGGKTTAALQALPSESLVVANDIMPQRAQVLAQNVIKWGAANCMVTCDKPRALGEMTHEFDIIAADVPCSGEGMFRKDPEAVEQWSRSLVQQCATRQRSILDDVWNALKPGGIMIYSTCTYNAQEDEEIVDYIIDTLGASVIEIPTLPGWNIHPSVGRNYPCYRFFPHRVKGEGLFMCVLRKNDAPSKATKPGKNKPSKTSSPNAQIIQAKSWVQDGHYLQENNGDVVATPSFIEAKLKEQYSKLHVVKEFGIKLGTIKGKKIVPSHQLAMSPHINPTAFTRVEVDYSTALAYLRGDAISIDAQQGYILVTYNGAILGFANNLGNRANNLYPKPWRIMSTHLPDTPPRVL